MISKEVFDPVIRKKKNRIGFHSKKTLVVSGFRKEICQTFSLFKFGQFCGQRNVVLYTEFRVL